MRISSVDATAHCQAPAASGAAAQGFRVNPDRKAPAAPGAAVQVFSKRCIHIDMLIRYALSLSLYMCVCIYIYIYTYIYIVLTRSYI